MKDLTDKIFGRLKAIRAVGKNKWGYYVWRCKCECGNEVKHTLGSRQITSK